MSSEKLDQRVCNRICQHMNLEHQNAVSQYAIHYAGIKDFEKAIIKSISNTYLELEVDNKTVKIDFDHILQDSEDAHRTLVAMLKSIPKVI